MCCILFEYHCTVGTSMYSEIMCVKGRCYHAAGFKSSLSPKAHFILKMDVNFSPESVNCTTTNIADSNNGLEMRESNLVAVAKNENPEELAELTEHLRRHTTQQGIMLNRLTLLFSLSRCLKLQHF